VVLSRRLALVLGGLVVAAVLAVGAALAADDPGPSAVDVGFLQDMIDHHEQANLLSAIALRGDASAPVRNLALDVIAAQRYEIGLMEGWLMRWGLERGAVGREAMGWMGMPVAVDEMPGMASVAELDALARLTGGALDVRYLELLLDHHRGGVHMAQAAVDGAGDAQVRWLAHQMARAQRHEIRAIETLLAG
jgi:uncharacterized protein (DUF305 family)